MFKHTAALLVASGVLSMSVAVAQTPLNPTQTTMAGPQQPAPIGKISVVGRTTPAINYRPRHDDTRIDFAGTSLMRKAHGEATVSGEKGHMKIDARFDKLDGASRFGREYLTYVLWAVTPEGRATNLGEIQVDHNDADAKMQVTTELQAFALIVTAEPYFAVTQPSDMVVMENVVRENTKGTVEVVDAKYELLTRGSYLMNQDAAKLKLKPLEPGSTLDLAEARNAVELSRVAGADQFAKETYDKAVRLLITAEDAKTRKQDSNAISMPARQAVQTAEDARIFSLKKQNDAYQAEQSRLGLAREQGATDRAQAETARLAIDMQARGAAAAEQDKSTLREQLRVQLNNVMDTRETARGLVVNLSDALFDTDSANLKTGAREKLARLSGILASHPGLRIAAEGYTDTAGTEDSNQRLSEQRADAVRGYLVQQGIPPGTVVSSGFGGGQPIAANDTAAGREQNRRVELVVSGDLIGKK